MLPKQIFKKKNQVYTGTIKTIRLILVVAAVCDSSLQVEFETSFISICCHGFTIHLLSKDVNLPGIGVMFHLDNRAAYSFCKLL